MSDSGLVPVAVTVLAGASAGREAVGGEGVFGRIGSAVRDIGCGLEISYPLKRVAMRLPE